MTDETAMTELRRRAFGQIVREQRERSGHSQEQLAARLGISAIQIEEVERGERGDAPRASQDESGFSALARALGLTDQILAERIRERAEALHSAARFSEGDTVCFDASLATQIKPQGVERVINFEDVEHATMMVRVPAMWLAGVVERIEMNGEFVVRYDAGSWSYRVDAGNVRARRADDTCE